MSKYTHNSIREMDIGQLHDTLQDWADGTMESEINLSHIKTMILTILVRRDDERREFEAFIASAKKETIKVEAALSLEEKYRKKLEREFLERLAEKDCFIVALDIERQRMSAMIAAGANYLDSHPFAQPGALRKVFKDEHHEQAMRDSMDRNAIGSPFHLYHPKWGIDDEGGGD